MKSTFLSIVIIVVLLGIEGCNKSSSPPGKSSPIAKVQSQSATIPGFQPSLAQDSVSSVEKILEKNIFNLPDERNVNKINEPAKETTEPPKPQEVEITGIVKTDGLFKVSIENRETNESSYIKKRDQIGNYMIGNVNWNEISAIDTSANETRVFMIGDRIPLPGTESSKSTGDSTISKPIVSSSANANSIDNNNSSRRRFRRSRQNTTDDTSVSSSASDLEEKLRQRRKMQEEE